MKRAKWPREACVFEVVSQIASGGRLRIGTIVEGGGPCCIGHPNEGQCGVIVLNGYSEYSESYLQWTMNLKPLTPAAKAMLAIAKASR